jgi:protein translocase SecG subunit
MDVIFSFDTLWWMLLIPYVVCCFGLIIIVLLQKGKGAGFAGAFGIGPGSEAVFGPRAGKSLPVRMTYIMAFLFMFLAICMSLIGGRLGMGIAPDAVTEAEAAELRQEQQVLDELQGLGVHMEEDAEADAGSSAEAAEGDGAAPEAPEQADEQAPESAPAGDAAEGDGT